MPALSTIQAELKEQEEWLIGLRQDPRMTLAKIRAELENQKGVKATPHQLETYFRNQKQRKNLPRHDWIAVFRALDSQKAFNRYFDVYISGNLIAEQSLQKKRKNAKPAQPLAECLADADRLLTRLPELVTVKPRPPPGSPRSQQHSITPESLSHTFPDVNPNSEARLLLDNILASSGPVPGPSIVRPDTGMNSISVGSRPASRSNENQSQLQIAPANMAPAPMFEPSYDLGGFEMDNGITFSFPGSDIWDGWTGQSSPGAFLRSLQSLEPASQNDRWAAEFNYASLTNITLDHHTREISSFVPARLPVSNSGSMIQRNERRVSDEHLPTAEEIIDNLQSLAVTNAADGGQFNLLTGSEVFTDQFVQLFLFSIVNNFAGLDGMPVKVMIEFINQYEPVRSRILCHLRNGASTIHSRALVEKLIEAAIEACDAKTVLDLLTLEIVRPDDIVCNGYHTSYHTTAAKSSARMTPIEKASKLRDLDVVGLLLRFDADVNKTYQPARSHSERGALECAIGRWGEYKPIDIKLVDLLLNNGATVSGELMGTAIRWGHTALVEKLMSRISPSEHVHCFDKVVNDAAEYLSNDIGYKFVRQCMQACRDMHNNECIDSKQARLVEVMYKAARRNNRDLVELLLPYGGQQGLDSALTAAARFGSHSLVRVLIAHGARANGPASSLKIDGHNPYPTTPLAQAIRRGDDQLVDLLAKEGAWDEIGERGRLGAALHAICQSGSLTYLLQVLQLVPKPDPFWLIPGMTYAINEKHEEVALRLIEAGAHPPNEFELPEVLRMKSRAITWAIFESDHPGNTLLNDSVLDAAIEWGDLEIIRALIFIGGGINAYCGRPPLSFAIKAGNRPLIDLMISLGADLDIKPSPEPRASFFEVRNKSITESSQGFSSPLSAAALVRDAETANYLLDHGADPADEEAISNAIDQDRRLLDLILEKFRQRYSQGRTGFGGRVLLHALQIHDEAALDLCLSAGFDVNNMVKDNASWKVSALGFAIKKHCSCLWSIPKLLDAGGDANLLASINGESRQTAFLAAIGTRNLPIVELLISRGADVQKAARLGLKRTPLQKACEVGSHPIVNLLLRHNADVNGAPAARGGATALQLAAKAGSPRIAKRLLDVGAKLDAPGVQPEGRSAIEYAAEYGRLDMISFLCSAADGKLPAGQYTNAITLAQKNGHPACADLLAELSVKNQAAINASSR